MVSRTAKALLTLPLLAGLSALPGIAAAQTPAPNADATRCAALVKASSGPVAITEATWQAAGPFTVKAQGGAQTFDLPAHCVVTGVIEKRTGADGKPYGMNFQMRLPQDWNGRFLFQGGGGINGVVAPALGLVKGPPALTRGFAVVTQDAGHGGNDASFGADQQARIDMIYRSYDRVTVEAKRLLNSYYGKPAAHNYFMGCSEGGREALLAAQRMATDYDGVVAGDPGFLLGVSFDDVAGRMAIAKLVGKGPDGKPDLASAFTPAQLGLLAQTIVAECDGKDGLKDGILDNAPACRPNLEALDCTKAAKGALCLSKPQIATLRQIFDGGLPAGRDYRSKGYYYTSAVDLPQWAGKLAGYGGLATPGVSSIQGLFSTPYDPAFDDYAIDFARDGARFGAVGGLNRADSVDYSTLSARGGKLLIYTGTADPGFTAKALVDYYQRLGAANGGADKAADFARLFLVPGMTHCRGGKALDEFDPLTAVVDWTEKGKAPEQLLSTGKSFPGRSRPVCAFPLQSRYKGSGSIEEAANFACRTPENGGK